jgi:hypothetical protein
MLRVTLGYTHDLAMNGAVAGAIADTITPPPRARDFARVDR